MLPNKSQATPTAHTPGAAAASSSQERLLHALTRNPKALTLALAAVVVVTGLVWAGVALGHAQARNAGFALTQAFAIKDALSSDLLAERELARKEAKSAALAHKSPDSAKDDGDDDGDDARDDGDDDDDATEEVQDASIPQFAQKASRDAAALEAFAALAEKHPGALGTLAALEAAALPQAQEAAYAPRAVKLLNTAAAPLPSHNALLALAALREAQIAEDMGDSVRALAACDRAISAQQQFLGDEVRLVKARLLMAKHDLQGAQAALEDVQNNYPQTALADELRIQMAALKLLEGQAPAAPAAPKAAVNAAG